MRRLLPEFEAEVKRSDGQSVARIISNSNIYSDYTNRIVPNEYNAHISGEHILRLQVNEFKNKRDLEGFALSRENYERVLRGLVRKYSSRIRWMTGTATGLKVSGSNLSILESVQVRTHDGTEKDIPASLIIGKAKVSC